MRAAQPPDGSATGPADGSPRRASREFRVFHDQAASILGDPWTPSETRERGPAPCVAGSAKPGRRRRDPASGRAAPGRAGPSRLRRGPRSAQPGRPAAPHRLRALLQRRPALPAGGAARAASRRRSALSATPALRRGRRQLPAGRPGSPLQQLQRAVQPPPARPAKRAVTPPPARLRPRPPAVTTPRRGSSSATASTRKAPKRSTRVSPPLRETPPVSISTASRPTWRGRWPPSARRRAATKCSSGWPPRMARSSSKPALSQPARAPRRRIIVRQKDLLDPRLRPRRPGRGRGHRRRRRRCRPNLTKTIEAQRRLTVERPDDAAVFNDLGNLLLLVPQPAEAEAAYRTAIELDPDKVVGPVQPRAAAAAAGRAARGRAALPAGGES